MFGLPNAFRMYNIVEKIEIRTELQAMFVDGVSVGIICRLSVSLVLEI